LASWLDAASYERIRVDGTRYVAAMSLPQDRKRSICALADDITQLTRDVLGLVRMGVALTGGHHVSVRAVGLQPRDREQVFAAIEAENAANLARMGCGGRA